MIAIFPPFPQAADSCKPDSLSPTVELKLVNRMRVKRAAGVIPAITPPSRLPLSGTYFCSL